MIKTPLSTVIGGAFWTPSATILGGTSKTFDQLIKSLFANNEQGFAYDPNDLTTMYQDAAGTVPVTAAGQPVGLILDKSKGLLLDTEKAVNGTNPTELTNWSTGIAGSNGLAAVNGRVRATRTGESNPRAALELKELVVGTLYKASIDVYRGTSSVPQIIVRTSTSASLTPILNSITVDQVYQKVEFLFIASATTMFIGAVVSSPAIGEYFEVANVSVKKILGNHAYQTISSMRPLLVASPQRLDYDTADDKLITTLPAQLTGCTVVRSVPNVGMQILTNQTIPTSYNDNTDHCGLIVINRALTATETSQITKLFNKAVGV